MNTDYPPVAVVTEKRSRKGLLWVAGAMAAVLMGGSTFALWSSNALFQGGTITAGDLQLVSAASTSFYDVSPDRTDATDKLPGTDGSQKGHLITSLSNWNIVPGDKVATVFASTISLVGDNMVAKLSVANLVIPTGNASLTWTYEIYKADTELVAEGPLPSNGTLLYLSAPGQQAGSEDANGTTVYPMTASPETLTIVIYAEFDPTAGTAGQSATETDGTYTDQTTDATGTRQDAQSAAALADIILQLDQVRDTGVIFKTAP